MTTKKKSIRSVSLIEVERYLPSSSEYHKHCRISENSVGSHEEFEGTDDGFHHHMRTHMSSVTKIAMSKALVYKLEIEILTETPCESPKKNEIEM